MTRKLIKQNKTFFSIVTIIFILFGLVLYFGGNKIYEKEAKWRHGNAVAQLDSVKKNINVLFEDLEHDLFFLRDISSSREYVDSDFESIDYKNKVEELLYEFSKFCTYYYQIRIIDSSGNEVIRIDNKHDDGTVVVPKVQLQYSKDKDYFREAMKLDSDRIYVSSIHLEIGQEETEEQNFPVVSLSTPLFDSRNRRKGVLNLNMYFSKVLKHIPENMFIQTEDGNLISLRSDGSINFNKSHYDFSDNTGLINISDNETIHYSGMELLHGKKVVVAIFHKHPMLKATLQRLILVSIILLSLILGFILIIGYLNFLKFRELIGAQKAIIYSLAKLAEHRDSGTGSHLERTRNYSVILSKQLRQNNKYRKAITNEFIEDIFEAAPLHDIGKVGIRDSILLKESKLTQGEQVKMKEHVKIGKEILCDAIDKFKLKQSFLVMGKNICEFHHEKYNGKGHSGLNGAEIPLEARIFTICDAYDTIRSKRPYKDKLSHDDAVRKIKSDSGEHFDPDIVDAFLKCEKEFAKEEVRT